MSCLDILYDHYKETYILHKEAKLSRERYFLFTCLFSFLLSIFLMDAQGIMQTFNSYTKVVYNIDISFATQSIQSLIWVIFLYTFIRYCQSNIYIERQYKYIEKLEQDIDDYFNDTNKIFNRESINYLNNFPIVLDIIDFFYKWIFPILLIGIVIIKLYDEWIDSLTIWYKIFDSIIGICIIIIASTYLIFLHPLKKK